MTSDAALLNVGKEDGLRIWRVNKLKLEEVPKKEYGAFYDGDSYVVMNTKKNATFWDVHFWLGRNSTTDEMGTAAVKSVEIDQALGGFPTQYREVQGHESALFLSYFKDGIRYLAGGYDDGYHHFEDALKNFRPVLYRCKGKRNVRCTQVKCEKASLNLGDVFILDSGREIYVWMPPESGRLERIKGMARAKNIADKERPGICKIHVLDDSWKTDAAFWNHFGGREAVESVTKAQNDDENFWANNKDQVTLWRISDSSGEATVNWVAQGDDVKQNLLDTHDAFVLDAVNGGIYVWVGKCCTIEERGKALHWGQTYLNQQHLPSWTIVTRVLESTEPVLFTQWFAEWQGEKQTREFQPRLFQCSNESGRLLVEEVVNFDQESLDGDDVMIVDALSTIFVWIGANANAEEKKHAEKTANEYLKNGAVKRYIQASIQTIFQGSENPTFKKFFPNWDDNLFKNDARSVANMRKLLFA